MTGLGDGGQGKNLRLENGIYGPIEPRKMT
jgi:hypothetical protein